MDKKQKKVNADKLLACQHLLSEVTMSLLGDDETRHLATILTVLNNDDLTNIRECLLELK